MTTWIFRGRAGLSGVEFFVTAETEAEAIAKARAGNYDDYDIAGAETTDWTIDPNSGEEQ